MTNALEKFINLQKEVRYAISPLTLLEVTILRLIKPEISYDMMSLLARVEQIEDKLEKGQFFWGKKKKRKIKNKFARRRKRRKRGIANSTARGYRFRKGVGWSKRNDKKERIALYAFIEKGIPYLKKEQLW